VILSCGIGRLHFVETVTALLAAHVDARLIMGWIPRWTPRWLIQAAGYIVGRNDLARRLAVRTANGAIPRSRILSLPLAEGFAAMAFRLGQWGVICPDQAARLGWIVFGWASRRHLRDADIFHVRSGAGQGGAIATARKHGMRIVVDHSIAHPAEMERTLGPVYARMNQPFRMGLDSRFWRQVITDCDQADLVLTNSDYVRDTFLATGFASEKLRVAYLGVREDFIGLKNDYRTSDPIHLLFTGAFGLRKGAAELLDACEILRDRKVPVRLSIVGPAAEASDLLRGRGLEQTVLLEGMKLHDELLPYLCACDLYVFPTHAEGCAKSVMEAMAAGLPVITTRESGAPIVDHEHGLIVPRGDARAVADAIEALAHDSVVRERLGRAAACLIKTKYSWRNYGETVRGMYGELLAR
jgi:glycosyltransferase involved in cell wall biosynthesis